MLSLEPHSQNLGASACPHMVLCIWFTSLPVGNSPALPHLGVIPSAMAQRGVGPLAFVLPSQNTRLPGGRWPTPRRGKPIVPSRGTYLVSVTSKTRRPREDTAYFDVVETLCPAPFLVDQVHSSQSSAPVNQGGTPSPLDKTWLRESFTSRSKEPIAIGIRVLAPLHATARETSQYSFVVRSGFGFEAQVEHTSCYAFFSVSSPATDKLLGEGFLKEESWPSP